jgi:hypothetical protein
MMNINIFPRLTEGAQVSPIENGWRLQIPPGSTGVYRWAQLDDYMNLPRKAFPHQAPFEMRLRARVSAANLPGTWGFGLWNDPFSSGLGLSGMRRWLPALPQAAWFFHASEQNHLSLRDDLPANGMLMGVFQSAGLPVWALLPIVPLLPGLVIPAAARMLRRAARVLIKEDARQLMMDFREWHEYRLVLLPGGVKFFVDGQLQFETVITPRSRMGLVLWLDNQFAAFRPDGRLAFGTQACSETAWMEIVDLEITAE